MKVTIDGHEAFGTLFSVSWPKANSKGQWCFTCRSVAESYTFVSGGLHDIVIDGRPCRAKWPDIRSAPELKGAGPFPFSRAEWTAIIDADGASRIALSRPETNEPQINRAASPNRTTLAQIGALSLQLPLTARG